MKRGLRLSTPVGRAYRFIYSHFLASVDKEIGYTMTMKYSYSIGLVGFWSGSRGGYAPQSISLWSRCLQMSQDIENFIARGHLRIPWQMKAGTYRTLLIVTIGQESILFLITVPLKRTTASLLLSQKSWGCRRSNCENWDPQSIQGPIGTVATAPGVIRYWKSGPLMLDPWRSCGPSHSATMVY